MPASTHPPAPAVLPLVMLLACTPGAGPATATKPQPTPSTPSTPATPATPATPTPTNTEPTPDPITRPLDAAQAHKEASRLAEAAFAARKDIVDAAGKPVGPQQFPPEEFIGGLEGERWKLRNEPPAGSWARVSFGKFGERPEVEVGFASR